MQITILLVILIIFAVLVTLLKSKVIKGKIGELMVAKSLDHLGPPYRVLNNLTFIAQNDSTQIDHIVISKYGIFIIETKNFQGKIYGKSDDLNWTQIIHGNKRNFQNPIRQNYKHKKFLSEYFSIPENIIATLVAFTGDSEFPNGMPNGVFRPNGLIDEIQSYESNKISNEDVDILTAKFQEIGKTTNEKSQTHLDNLKAKRKSNAKSVELIAVVIIMIALLAGIPYILKKSINLNFPNIGNPKKQGIETANEKDDMGKTLQEETQRKFSFYFKRQEKNCKASFDHGTSGIVDVEIENCEIKYTPEIYLSHSDSSAGINLKGFASIAGSSYRSNKNGSWTDWNNSQPSDLILISMRYIRKNGEFELTPSTAFEKIRIFN